MDLQSYFDQAIGLVAAVRWEHHVVAAGLVLGVWGLWRWRAWRRSKELYHSYAEIPPGILRRMPTRRELERLSGNVDYIIIGSGLGGLTSAAVLTRLGYEVLVLEQHYKIGGSTHTYRSEGFDFDIGVHYVGSHMGSWWSPFRILFDILTDGKLEWSRLDETLDVAYNASTGERLPITGSRTEIDRVFLKHFPDLTKRALRRYRWHCFIARQVASLSFLLKLWPPGLTSLMWPLYAPLYRRCCLRTTIEVMRSCDLPDDAIGALLYSWGDYGTTPAESPFFIQAYMESHYIGGGYFPKGGTSSIPKTLVAAITKRGGVVLAASPVDHILTKQDEHGRHEAVGVGVHGLVLMARKGVISDAGYAKTFGLGSKPLPAPLVSESAGSQQQLLLSGKAFSPSRSFFYLCVGLDGTDKELGLPAQNIWHMASWDHDAYMREHDATLTIEEAMKKEVPLAFLSNESAKDRDWPKKHPGKSAVTIVAWTNAKWFKPFAPSTHKDRGDEYVEIKRLMMEKLLEILYLHFPKTKGCVRVAELGSPLTVNHYLGRESGEIYNLDHNVSRFNSLGAQLALHPETTVKRLYLAGQDQFAVSVEGAMLSGLFASARASLLAFVLLSVPALLAFIPQ